MEVFEFCSQYVFCLILILCAYIPRNFWFTLAFVHPDFHPVSCHTFLLDFCREVLVYGKPSELPTILHLHPNLGARTEHVLLIQRGEQFPFILQWMNDLKRPNGQTLPISCPKCHILEPWVVATPGKNGLYWKFLSTLFLTIIFRILDAPLSTLL